MITVLLGLLSGLPAALSAQVVRDSASGAPGAGVLVTLIDAASPERRTVLTDESGRYTIAAAGAGSFTLETKPIGVRPVLTPQFALAAGETSQLNMVVAGADVAVPPLAKVRAELCPESHATAVVLGTVRTPSGAPAAWATLRYRWSRFESVPATESSPLPAGARVSVLQSAPGATLVADSRGRYLICDVAAGRYRLTLESQTGEVAEGELKVDAGQIVLRDLALRRQE